jgi:hypothetical protein
MSRDKNPFGRNVARTSSKIDSIVTNRLWKSSKTGGYKSGTDRWEPSSKSTNVTVHRRSSSDNSSSSDYSSSTDLS